MNSGAPSAPCFNHRNAEEYEKFKECSAMCEKELRWRKDCAKVNDKNKQSKESGEILFSAAAKLGIPVLHIELMSGGYISGCHDAT